MKREGLDVVKYSDSWPLVQLRNVTVCIPANEVKIDRQIGGQFGPRLMD